MKKVICKSISLILAIVILTSLLIIPSYAAVSESPYYVTFTSNDETKFHDLFDDKMTLTNASDTKQVGKYRYNIIYSGNFLTAQLAQDPDIVSVEITVGTEDPINIAITSLPTSLTYYYGSSTSGGIRCRIYSGNIQVQFYKWTPTADVTICYNFKSEESAYKITAITSDENKGTVTQPSTNGNNVYTLTASPSTGYQLAYIQVGEDTNTRIECDDGISITWTATADAEYTAYFEPVTAKLGGMYLHLGSTTYSGYAHNVFAGQRGMLGLTYTLVSQATGQCVINAYAGTDTSQEPLAIYSGGTNAQTHQLINELVIESMPDVEQITITAQIGDGEVVSKTYNVSVANSGSMTLDYLTTPADTNGCYPTDSKTSEGGPNIYDACAFVNETTGALSMYLAVNGGIMKYNPSAASSLVYMNGLSMPYNSNAGASGYAFAIGGSDEKSLAALVKESGIETSYFVYTFSGEVWSKVESSALSYYGLDNFYGLVMTQNDIWVSNQHWNGTSWTPNAITFNSFWKDDNQTAYAGSDNGIYKYNGSEWTLVSGTSGSMYIASAARTADGAVMTVSNQYRVESRAYSFQPMAGTISKVTITGDSATVETINTDGISLPNNKGIYVGIDNSGELYAITAGRNYGAYDGCYIYRRVSGAWQNQNVAAFNNATDNANIADGKVFGVASGMVNKVRPDGVRYILNPCDGVTLFAGQSGAIYAKYGETTITFNSNEGSAVQPITQAAGSKVTAPASPTLDGQEFAGWYTRPSLVSTSLFTFDTMPFSNITLYAKWAEEGGDSLSATRTAALKSLENELKKYNEIDYTEKSWEALETEYSNGTVNINGAKTYDAIQTALNNAIAAMADVEKSGTITIAVTVEKFRIDGSYIIEPMLVTVDRYELASVAITNILKDYYPDYVPSDKYANPYRFTGSLTNGFYLQSIYDPTYDPAALGQGQQLHDGFLSEFDGGPQSGWMYCVNGVFPGVGASDWTLQNRDVMRWQYSVNGWGADVGSGGFSSSDAVKVADKDDLIWKVAEINAMSNKDEWLSTGDNQAHYNDAMSVLKIITAPQAAVDAAYESLGGVIDPTEKLARAKAVAIQDIQSFNTYMESYRPAEQTLLTGYISEGVANVKAATTVEEVTIAYNAMVELVHALKTDFEYKADEDAAVLSFDTVFANTQAYIKTKAATPEVGSTNGEWAVLGLARSGAEVADDYYDGYYAKVVAYVNDNITATGQLHSTKSTDNSRIVVALTAIGKDPTNVDGNNLLTALADLDYVKQQGINGPIWALIAFDTLKYDIPTITTSGTQATRDNLIQAILDTQLANGGWSLSYDGTGDDTIAADPDMTAMAMQALAPYYSTNATVKAALDSAVTCLSGLQKSNGGYASWGTENAESCAQVIVALSALGIDAGEDTRFIKGEGDDARSLIEGLFRYYIYSDLMGGGAFSHKIEGMSHNLMATEQAYYAMTAYDRLKNGKTSLYDMTDLLGDAGVSKIELGTQTATPGTNNTYSIVIPYSESAKLPDKASDFTVTLSDSNANITTPLTTADSGKTWTFTVTAKDGSTTADYTINVSIGVDPAADSKTAITNAKNAINEIDTWIVPQATANIDTAVKEWLDGQLDAIETNTGVTVTVTVNTCTPAVTGTATNKTGTNGSFTFSVVLAAGEGNAAASDNSITGKTGTITATSFKSSDAGVSTVSVSGKTGSISGTTITVVLDHDATISAESSAVSITTKDGAAVVSSLATANEGTTWTFTVTAEDGTTTENYTITVSIAADPAAGNRADVEAAKSLIDSGVYTISADTAALEADLKAELESRIASRISSTGVAATVTITAVEAAIDGTAGDLDGTDGSFSFTVVLSKGEAEAKAEGTITGKTGTITAKAYVKSTETGITGITVAGVNATGSDYAYTVTVPYGTELTAGDFSITLKDSKADITAGPAANGNVWSFTVTAESDATATYTVTVSFGANPAQDNIDAVAAARTTVSGASYNTRQDAANTSDAIKSAIEAKLDTLDLGEVSASVEMGDVSAAVAGTSSNIAGTNGSFTATVTLSKGVGETLATDRVSISGTITATKYVAPPSEDKIHVTFRLIGAEVATQDVNLSSSSYLPDYVTWVPTTSYTLPEGSMVYVLFMQAMSDAELRQIGADSNYVETIYAPSSLGGYELSEFTNGPFSGWMYTINGSHPSNGLKEQTLSDGDVVVWHYENDYRHEIADWFGDPAHPSLGDGTYYNGWLKASDTFGGKATKPSDPTNPSKPTDPSTGETVITPSVTVTGDTANATVGNSDITTAVDAASKTGAENVTVKVETDKDVDAAKVTISKTNLNKIASDADAGLVLDTPAGSVTIPNSALDTIVSQSNTNVEFSITQKTAEDVTNTNVDATDAIIVEVTVTSNGKAITSFGGQSVTIGVPVDSTYVEGQSYRVVIISGDSTEIVYGKCVKVDGKLTVQVETTHLSTFVVTNKTAMAFTDTTGHWALNAIQYAWDHDLMDGVGDNKFNPDGTLNRAMLVTILYRLEGEPAVTAANPFTDVPAGQWYTNAIIWAAENKIVEGYGDGLFGPTDKITREQMAKMLFAYTQFKKYDTTKANDLAAYTDAPAVSAWALESMKWANAEGLVTGTTATTLNPGGDAKRAEAATILMRYMNNVVN